MKNEKMFKEYMTLLGEMCKEEISDTLKSLYWKILEPFSDIQCEEAFQKLLATWTYNYFPKPGHITEIILGNKEEKALEAWLRVDKAMSRIGNYESIDFGDPRIHKCIELLGGWEYLGTIETQSEWTWKRKEFLGIYNNISTHDAPDHVIGIFEKNNHKLGIKPRILKLKTLPLPKLALIK